MATLNASTTGDEVVKLFSAQTKGKTGMLSSSNPGRASSSTSTVLITGPSESGVGGQTAIFLAAGKPQHILLAGRNRSKIQPVIDEIHKNNPDVTTTFIQLDLTDLSSVRKAAKEVNDKIEKLDVLINNAGSELKSLMALSLLTLITARSHGDQGLCFYQRWHRGAIQCQPCGSFSLDEPPHAKDPCCWPWGKNCQCLKLRLHVWRDTLWWSKFQGEPTAPLCLIIWIWHAFETGWSRIQSVGCIRTVQDGKYPLHSRACR